ncbi:recombinase family protein [Butyricicoccus pullicaecorum]|uniref:recombinase family protein n=1 Tax=Butyricicoccus pullicaecorum TaxID=501571 RepID=UPI00351FDB00
MRIGYVRVSTEEQNEARQVEALDRWGIDKFFIEKRSGKNLDRPVLQEMLDFIREGDTVYVHDLSRISRSLTDLLNLVELLQKKKVHFVSNKESVDTTSANGRLFLTIIGAINEFERANLLERQREGIAIAKREGKFKGRKARTLDNVAELYDMWIRREKSKAEIARDYQISRPTLDRLFKEYEKAGALGRD